MVSSSAAAASISSDREELSDVKSGLSEQTYTAKGVSKMDGTLTIQPPPTSVAVLRANGDSIIFHGQVATELARKGSSLQLVDEIISLGSYEVEVLLMVGSGVPSLTLAKRPTLCQVPSRNSMGTQTVGTGPLRSNEIPGRCLHPITSNIPRNSQNIPTTKKRSLVNRKPKSQPKRTKTEASVATSVTTSIQITSDCTRTESLPRKPLPLFQRPLKRSAITLGSYPKMRSPVPPYGKRSTLTTLANSNTSRKSLASRNFFPGAVGNPDVPHCIKIEGVAFLWNCLTGHGKVAHISPHCIPHDDSEEDQMTYRGCILGDGTSRCFRVSLLIISRL
jgi:hypothetical protein